MKQENNGKIAIAIVAMFVVALSVVGFTYAYFTARIQGNTNTTSVDVTAGKLSVVYAKGAVITAQNIVPGWASDGVHFYDPQYSITGSHEEEVNGVTSTVHEISAVEYGTGEGQYTTKSDGTTTPTESDGLVTPATFTVSNASDNAGANSYIIKLVEISNTISDPEHLYVSLYKNDGTTPLWSGNFQNITGNELIIVPTAETLAADVQGQTPNVNSYSVKLTYQNVTNANQDSLGATFSAKIKIVGVAQNTSNAWVDEDGNTITFTATSGEIPLTVTNS